MDQDESKALLDVADAAVAWWIDKCPVNFSEKEHFKNPTINLVTESEKKLALCVADLLTFE